MKIEDYLKTKEVTREELIENFKKVRRFEVNIFNHKGECFNCGDLLNHEDLKVADGWQHAQYCYVCKSISVAYEADRQGGANMDVVEVYQEEKEKSEEYKILNSVASEPQNG